MAVVIRLSRIGRKNRPSYRISVADNRYPLDGRVVEDIGVYDPMSPKPEERMKVDAERARHWIGVGAKPSDTVRSILNRLGAIKDLRVKTPVKRPGRSVDTKTRISKQSAAAKRAELKAARRVERQKARKLAKAAKAAAGPEEKGKKK